MRRRIQLAGLILILGGCTAKKPPAPTTVTISYEKNRSRTVKLEPVWCLLDYDEVSIAEFESSSRRAYRQKYNGTPSETGTETENRNRSLRIFQETFLMQISATTCIIKENVIVLDNDNTELFSNLLYLENCTHILKYECVK